MDVGYLSRNKETAKLIKRIGGNVDFTSRQAFRALELLMAPNQKVMQDDVIWVTPMAWGGTVESLSVLKSPTFQILQDMEDRGAAAPEGDDLRERLWSLSPEEGQKLLVEFLSTEIARILRVAPASIAAKVPVSDFGVDSLMGVELGLAAQKSLGDDLPLMTISEGNSIETIAQKIIEHIHSTTSAVSGTILLGDLAAQHLQVHSDTASSSGDTI